MTALPCQRWRERRPRYRPAGERIEPARYAVDLVEERAARPFVGAHHYSGTFPAARRSIGLFRGAVLVGVAVFGVPAQAATIPRWTGLPASSGVVLSRFVLLDDVPGNGETWFLRRAFAALRVEIPDLGAVVSYSDPVERLDATGRRVKPGHVGVIYQAFNGRYLGRSAPETMILDPAGRSIDRRGLSKIRNGETGAAGAVVRLVAAGAPTRRPHEDGAAYVARALAEGPFVRVRHPGNHVYAWPLSRRVVLPDGGAYPRAEAA